MMVYELGHVYRYQRRSDDVLWALFINGAKTEEEIFVYVLTLHFRDATMTTMLTETEFENFKKSLEEDNYRIGDWHLSKLPDGML